MKSLIRPITLLVCIEALGCASLVEEDFVELEQMRAADTNTNSVVSTGGTGGVSGLGSSTTTPVSGSGGTSTGGTSTGGTSTGGTSSGSVSSNPEVDASSSDDSEAADDEAVDDALDDSTDDSAGDTTGGTCDTASDWVDGSDYVEGDVVKATCDNASFSGSCTGGLGSTGLFSCKAFPFEGFCKGRKPGTNGWAEAWTQLSQCI